MWKTCEMADTCQKVFFPVAHARNKHTVLTESGRIVLFFSVVVSLYAFALTCANNIKIFDVAVFFFFDHVIAFF